MKKVFSLIIVGVVLTAALMAFDGNTSASLAYTFEEGEHDLGLSSQSVGYFGSGKVGYFIGVDADFNIKDESDWNVGMIIGPSFRYAFTDAGVTATVALGVSAEGSAELFAFGVGGYAGGDWQITDHFGLGVGVKLGNNFVSVPFSNTELTVVSRFYVTPVIGVHFYY